MKFGVIIFPGSNCDMDVIHVLRNVLSQEVEEIWHKETSLNDFGEGDCIILPGGFSYGDYLRAGAIARFSPVMDNVVRFARNGGYVMGICNGFQILCEAGLLPGALVRNLNQQFVCKNVFVRVETASTRFTSAAVKGQVLKIPIAHAEGRFVADSGTIARLDGDGNILLRYCTSKGEITPEANPNGTTASIAGICNEGKNVFGLMPHPERASEAALGNSDGRILFESLLSTVLAG